MKEIRKAIHFLSHRVTSGLNSTCFKSASVEHVINDKGVLNFLKKLMGNKKRKWLVHKLGLEHPLDVALNCLTGYTSDTKNKCSLVRVALLHDVLEDYDISPESLGKELNLSDIEIEELKALSRNYTKDYFNPIKRSAKLTLIKAGDRLANLNDLKESIDLIGLEPQMVSIYEKYEKENIELYEALMEWSSVDSEYKNSLIKILKSLTETMEEVGSKIEEEKKLYVTSANYEEHIKTQLNVEHLKKAERVLYSLLEKEPKLKELYPDIKHRMHNSIQQFKGLQKLPPPLFNRLVKKSLDKERDQLKGTVSRLNGKIQQVLLSIENMQEPLNIEDLSTEFAKAAGMSVGSFKDLTSLETHLEKEGIGQDKESVEETKAKIGKAYQLITKTFKRITSELISKLSKMIKEDGTSVVYRPTLFKEKDSYITKVIEGYRYKGIKSVLEITDLLGFRVMFKDLTHLFDFCLDFIEDEKNDVFKINRHLGKGSPYQGVNMNAVYQNFVYYECQATMASQQLATDLNHDIFYKHSMKVSKEEEEAVATLIQFAAVDIINSIDLLIEDEIEKETMIH